MEDDKTWNQNDSDWVDMGLRIFKKTAATRNYPPHA